MQVKEATPTPVKKTRRFNQLTFKEMLILRRELRKVLIKKDDGVVEYAEGFDDHKIAELMTDKLDRPVTYNNVGGMRRSEFGSMYTKNGSSLTKNPKAVTVTVDPNPELLGAVTDARVALEEARRQLLDLARQAQDIAEQVRIHRDALDYKTGEKS